MLGCGRRGFRRRRTHRLGHERSSSLFAQAAVGLAGSSGKFAAWSPSPLPFRPPPPCRVAIVGSTIARRASFRCQRSRLSGRWIVEQAEEEIEVRTRPQHEVVIRYDFVVIALACTLPEPLADITCLDTHRCLRE